MSSQTQPGGTYGSNLAEQVSVDAMEPGVSTPGSQTLHERNLEMLADIARRELLEAIKYERNYSPLTWFKSVPIAPRETGLTIRNMRNAKARRLALTPRKYNLAAYIALEAEIRELDKKLLEGKQ